MTPTRIFIEWKDIPGFEGLYQISNIGLVKSLERTAPCYLNGVVGTRRVCERILKPALNWNYWGVNLAKEGKNYTKLIHILVASTFLEKISGCEVHHKDNDKKNNLHTNLEWVPHVTNIRQAVADGTFNIKGARHYKARKVINSVTGEVYPTITQAAESNNLSRIALYLRLSGKVKNKTPLQYL